jgi:hypothetical protein
LNGGYDVNHPKKGIDILLKYNPNAKAAADMYKVERGEPTPIEPDEMKYLRYDLDDAAAIYDLMGRLDRKAALAEFKQLKVIGVRADEEDDEEEVRPVKRGPKAKKAMDDEDAFDDEDSGDW